MPYTKDNYPDAIKDLPEHAREIWIAAYNSAYEQYEGDEAKVSATAWAAVKTKYEKNEKGDWVMKKSEHAEMAVFRTGTHMDSRGNTRTWTEADLDGIVSKYRPSEHEAPVVIGHPENNSPAWGWVEGLRREGDILYAKLKDLVPEFTEMLRKKMFKKRSISLYPDGTLRHIGFLGAMPPAVKGLPDYAFREEEAAEIEFQEETHIYIVRDFFRRMREFLIERFGAETADRVVSPYDIDELAIKPEPATGGPAYNKKGKEDIMTFWEKVFSWFKGAPPSDFKESLDAEIKARVDTAVETERAALKAKEESFSEREKAVEKREEALKGQETSARKKAVKDFAERLKKEGILTPAMEKLGMGITAFLEAISPIETAYEFSEDKKKKETPLEFMQAFLSALPKSIEFGEVAKRDKDVAASGAAAEKLAALTEKKMKEDKDLSYAQAFAEVQKENPELAAEYAEELRG